jgi:hypothetical protein
MTRLRETAEMTYPAQLAVSGIVVREAAIGSNLIVIEQDADCVMVHRHEIRELIEALEKMESTLMEGSKAS